jgi:serine/threonine protein kinase
LNIKWGDIHILQKIGRGSFADVYLGDWNHTLVAVKKLSEKKMTEGAEEFGNEARLML